jgi:hypothetical protein
VDLIYAALDRPTAAAPSSLKTSPRATTSSHIVLLFDVTHRTVLEDNLMPL